MSADKHPAEVLAENIEQKCPISRHIHPLADGLAMLRRIPALEAERDQLRAEVEALRADVWRFRHVLSVAVVALAGAAEDRPEFKRPYQIVSDAIDAARKQQ